MSLFILKTILGSRPEAQVLFCLGHLLNRNLGKCRAQSLASYDTKLACLVYETGTTQLYQMFISSIFHVSTLMQFYPGLVVHNISLKAF